MKENVEILFDADDVDDSPMRKWCVENDCEFGSLEAMKKFYSK